MSKYIIIDAEAIQQRIEELEKQMTKHISHASKTGDYDSQFEDRLDELKHILSQSTPLIPEIDRAYWAGMQFVGEDKGSPNEYISNLKLDI